MQQLRRRHPSAFLPPSTLKPYARIQKLSPSITRLEIQLEIPLPAQHRWFPDSIGGTHLHSHFPCSLIILSSCARTYHFKSCHNLALPTKLPPTQNLTEMHRHPETKQRRKHKKVHKHVKSLVKTPRSSPSTLPPQQRLCCSLSLDDRKGTWRLVKLRQQHHLTSTTKSSAGNLGISD